MRSWEERIKNITKSGRNFGPTLINYYPLPDIKFNGNCLIKIIMIPPLVR